MTINLLTNEEHAQLRKIFNDFPNLTLQNKGYEEIALMHQLTDEDKAKIKEVEVILKKAILGFRRFQNFRLDKDGNLQLRFQYAYSASFTGVGYILWIELLNGFKE